MGDAKSPGAHLPSGIVRGSLDFAAASAGLPLREGHLAEHALQLARRHLGMQNSHLSKSQSVENGGEGGRERPNRKPSPGSPANLPHSGSHHMVFYFLKLFVNITFILFQSLGKLYSFTVVNNYSKSPGLSPYAKT